MNKREPYDFKTTIHQENSAHTLLKDNSVFSSFPNFVNNVNCICTIIKTENASCGLVYVAIMSKINT